MLKVTVTKSKPTEDIKYPCLMIASNGDILLAIDNNIGGTIVHTIKTSYYSIGEHSKGWEPSHFKPFYGKITLEQD